MKLKNKTSTIRLVIDLSKNEQILVKPNEIIEVKKAEFNTSEFEVIINIEEKEEIKKCKEVK